MYGLALHVSEWCLVTWITLALISLTLNGYGLRLWAYGFYLHLEKFHSIPKDNLWANLDSLNEAHAKSMSSPSLLIYICGPSYGPYMNTLGGKY